MLVFFIFFSIIYLLGLLILLSTIKIEIDTFKLEKNKTTKVNDFKIKLYLVVGKIKWLKLEISKEKLEKINFKKLTEKISSLNIIEDIKGKTAFKNKNIIINSVKDANIKFEKLNLCATIGLENIFFLTYLVAILDILLSIYLAKKANSISHDDYKYIITPCQTNNLCLKISINCIISIKIANIINIVLKKRGKKDEQSSNRIFNGNSHEQYTRYGGRKYNNRRTNICR